MRAMALQGVGSPGEGCLLRQLREVCGEFRGAGVTVRRPRTTRIVEQSWRMGGASGAEIAALEAFRADPDLRSVHASTVEVYGDGAEPPAGAMVYFRGIDDKVGAILKYALVERR